MAVQSTLKRPAAQALKRPAVGGGKKQRVEEEKMEPPPLTEEALKEHEKFLKEMAKKKDLSQEQFDQALAKLPSTKAEALQKWGKDELKDRLQKGTIQARRNPMDKSYWEFKAIVQSESTFVHKNKETQYGTGWNEVGH